MATCSASYEDILIESGRTYTSTSNGAENEEIDMASAVLTEAGAGGAISTAISATAAPEEVTPNATTKQESDNAKVDESQAGPSDEEQPKQEV